MTNKQIAGNSSQKKISEIDAIIEEGVNFSVSVAHMTIWHKLRLLPKKKEFVLYPATMGTLLKISKEMNKVDLPDVKESKLTVLEYALVCMDKGIDGMVKSIGYSIVNSKKNPSKRLLSYLLNNLTPSELAKIWAMVVKQADISSFFGCITSMTMMRTMTKGETSEVSGAETRGEQSAA